MGNLLIRIDTAVIPQQRSGDERDPDLILEPPFDNFILGRLSVGWKFEMKKGIIKLLVSFCLHNFNHTRIELDRINL